jgi:hypothetical protein
VNSIIGAIGWHMVGAASAASFYAPIGKVKRWSWETTWAVAGIFSWVLLPIGVSLYFLPDFKAFYAGLDSNTVLKAFLFGGMWGIGNVSYGLTMRYMGMSLGIGIAIGTTLVVGTLMPPFMHGQFMFLFNTQSGLVTLAGILVAVTGVAIVTYAGHQKEKQLGLTAEQLDIKKGLMLAIMCGIFSSGMSFAIDSANHHEWIDGQGYCRGLTGDGTALAQSSLGGQFFGFQQDGLSGAIDITWGNTVNIEGKIFSFIFPVINEIQYSVYIFTKPYAVRNPESPP